MSSVNWANNLAIVENFPTLIEELGKGALFRTTPMISKLLVEKRLAENIAEAKFAVDVSALWMLANFLDTHEVVLCSPEGVTMRCPLALRAHGDAFEWWSWPMSGQKFGTNESFGYLDCFRNGNFRAMDACDRFCVIDFASGLVKLKPNSAKLISTSSYGHKSNEDEVRKFIDTQVRPVLGWAVCVNPSDVPEKLSQVYKNLGFKDLDWALIDTGLASKAPDRTPQLDVLECILCAYPHGKKGDTWEVVERRIGYSRRHIIRALKQNGVWDAWSKGLE